MATSKAQQHPLTKQTRRDIAKLKTKVERHIEGIAKHRDALREILGDIEEHINSSSDAVELLEEAVDKLSETL